MIEVEIKIPLDDRDQTARELLRYGFTEGNLIRESDIYFNNDSFDLRKQDMALRVRSCENRTTGVSESFLTFKGPKLDDRSMTRKELETEVGDTDVCMELFQALGYYPLKPVRKLRQYFHYGKMTACLDQVDGLGDFLELEILLGDEDAEGNVEECGLKDGCNSEEVSEEEDKSELREECDAGVESERNLEEGRGTERACKFEVSSGTEEERSSEEICGVEKACKSKESREDEKELRVKMAREAALRRMDEVLEALGLDRSRMTRTSYLSMLYGK